MTGLAEIRASADEMQRSGVMLSLLNSLSILCPPYGPPAGSAKQPTDVKPSIAETVVLALEENVVVMNVLEDDVEVLDTEVLDADVLDANVLDVDVDVGELATVVELDDEEDVELLETDRLVEAELELEDDELEEDTLVEVELDVVVTRGEEELDDWETDDEVLDADPLDELDPDAELKDNELELELTIGLILLYIVNKDEPPHYNL